jgi:gamma-carbonic anhydrase
MLIEHRGGVPEVHPSAYVAPTAVICGAVRIGPDARVLFGAVLSAEDGQIGVGARSIVMENAVIRGRARHPVVIGDDVLVGPHAHVNGAQVGDGCFLATGVSLFPGCVAGAGSEVRIGGIVQVNTVLPPGTMVPIGWVAVGDPAKICPPGEHEQIWERITTSYCGRRTHPPTGQDPDSRVAETSREPRALSPRRCLKGKFPLRQRRY